MSSTVDLGQVRAPQIDDTRASAEHPWSGAKTNAEINKRGYTFSKIHPWLYDFTSDSPDYANAYAWFNAHGNEGSVGGCSVAHSGNIVGRHFDWKYDNSAEFVVHVPAVDGHLASVGVSANIPGLAAEYVDAHQFDDLYKLVPFFTTDGVNEQGLFVASLVVPKDNGENVSVPAVSLRDTVNGIMLVRYMLDRFARADEACEYVRDYVSVWFPESLHNANYEIHYYVQDTLGNARVLEFVSNEAKIVNMNAYRALTNFYVFGITPNSNGTVYTPATLGQGSPTANNLITEHGSGLERWNAIVNWTEDIGTVQGMRALMQTLRYTKAYSTSEEPSDPYWYTEFVGGTIHCDTPVSGFTSIVQATGQEYLDRSRDTGTTWQTVHSAVYDLDARTLLLEVQEDGETIECGMGSLYERVNALEKNKANTSDIPTALSELSADASHRLVTDAEKDTWNAKADENDIPDIDETLTQSGAAADAAATGAGIAAVHNEVTGSRHSFATGDTLTGCGLGETWACISAAFTGTLHVPAITNTNGHCTDVLRIIFLAGAGAAIEFDDDTVLWSQTPTFTAGRLYEIIISDLYDGVFSASYTEYILPEGDA